jgi:hypothetical protein
MGLCGRHVPVDLPPGKTRYPLYRRLGGPQGRCGQVREISPRTGILSQDRPARSQVRYPARRRTGGYDGNNNRFSQIFYLSEM